MCVVHDVMTYQPSGLAEAGRVIRKPLASRLGFLNACPTSPELASHTRIYALDLSLYNTYRDPEIRSVKGRTVREEPLKSSRFLRLSWFGPGRHTLRPHAYGQCPRGPVSLAINFFRIRMRSGGSHWGALTAAELSGLAGVPGTKRQS